MTRTERAVSPRALMKDRSEARVAGESTVCALTGTRFPALPTPDAVIIDVSVVEIGICLIKAYVYASYPRFLALPSFRDCYNPSLQQDD